MLSIFICYAHTDNESTDSSKRWLNRLRQQLAPLELEGQVEIWSDQKIKLGEDWHDKIQTTLEQVKAAVLLVSPAFLDSQYIRNSELPVLLKNAKNKGVVILPVLLRKCLWDETKFKYPDPKEGPEELSLASLQGPSTKPLNSLPEHEQDDVLYKIARRIHQIVNPQPSELPRETESKPENNSLVTPEELEEESNKEDPKQKEHIENLAYSDLPWKVNITKTNLPWNQNGKLKQQLPWVKTHKRSLPWSE